MEKRINAATMPIKSVRTEWWCVPGVNLLQKYINAGMKQAA
ncbi:hypothetical protein [Noviherbaspirillum sp. UKPF54]|nr:hypothetical protein [Noviherbaspirillum sp. UKPF54]